MKRRILAMVLALVMAFALLTVASAADVVTVGTNGDYATVAAAITAEKYDIKLVSDVTATVTIPVGKEVTIDLNGYDITVNSGDAIVNLGNLTVKGSGKVTAKRAAIGNAPGATAVLNGGSYMSTGWYTIKNLGTMVIDGKVSVAAGTTTASVIDNGYYGNKDNDTIGGVYYNETNKTSDPTLTIKSGDFVGRSGENSCSVIKNDDYGILFIEGGTFDSTANSGNQNAATILNWNVATISGGTFKGRYPISNGNLGPADKGELTITDGTFEGSSTIFGQNGGATPGSGKITISGGKFTAPNSNKNSDFTYDVSVSGGNFSYSLDGTDMLDTHVNVELKKADGTYSYFDSVDKAVAAAEDGDEVVILDKAAGATYCTVTLVTSEFGETLASSTFEAEKGNTVTLPVLAEKNGHEFAGWYTDILAGEPVGTLTRDNGYAYVVTGNVTLYARWAYDGGIIVPIIPTIGGSSFTDVPGSAYYKTAVDWAVSKGIASGTSAKTFSPDAACTRGQAVTFIWRAAGSPAPKSTVNPFKDVKATDYCYDAVLWAVEQGITNGTTATTFSPDKACTRGEIVTLLYRASGSPAGYAANSGYVDVSAKSYCATAVSWAVALRITTGTSINTFSPDAACTRAKIVTYLYRSAR